MLGNVSEEVYRLQHTSALQDQRLASAAPTFGLFWRQEHRRLLQQEWAVSRKISGQHQALEHLQCFSKELPLGHNQQDWGQTITWPPLSTPEVIIFKEKFVFLYFLAAVWPWAQILNCGVYNEAGPRTFLEVLNDMINKKLPALCALSFLQYARTTSFTYSLQTVSLPSAPHLSQNHAWPQIASFWFVYSELRLFNYSLRSLITHWVSRWVAPVNFQFAVIVLSRASAFWDNRRVLLHLALAASWLYNKSQSNRCKIQSSCDIAPHG